MLLSGLLLLYSFFHTAHTKSPPPDHKAEILPCYSAVHFVLEPDARTALARPAACPVLRKLLSAVSYCTVTLYSTFFRHSTNAQTESPPPARPKLSLPCRSTALPAQEPYVFTYRRTGTGHLVNPTYQTYKRALTSHKLRTERNSAVLCMCAAPRRASDSNSNSAKTKTKEESRMAHPTRTADALRTYTCLARARAARSALALLRVKRLTHAVVVVARSPWAVGRASLRVPVPVETDSR